MFQQVDHQKARQLIAEGELIIADIRDKDSYREDHIKSAIHLSMASMEEFIETADKDQAILVYCYHGVSSQSAAQYLVDQGFVKVYTLSGGFEKWKEHYSTSDREND